MARIASEISEGPSWREHCAPEIRQRARYELYHVVFIPPSLNALRMTTII